MSDFPPVHPGEVLIGDFLKPLGLSQKVLAKALCISQTHISDVVNGRRAISAETALRLSRYFGTTAEFWIGMQATYELELARDHYQHIIDAEVKPCIA
ncbi:addiction module HigA family antidote [Rhizobium rosettiformans]|uniref:Addiction module antidote protein, HigA family n=2 Tax=Rhizobium rosettiformans TaxID=1368430 RepID=A0A4S8PMN1_9HYPH|nr:HigA family addiction module antitoxin [Rhizobium rosettiformans]MBB5278630.1 addiction module HigA family antidote [Rhizobium rosettiformans]THV29859.1 addiction module antidote protein, HigA family [Rhizobium rosettiformans W3]